VMNRVCVARLPRTSLVEPTVVVVSRLVLTGGSHHRLHEELTEAGGYLTESGFRRADRLSDLKGWLLEGRYDRLDDGAFEVLANRFDRSQKNIMSAVDARSKDRLKSLDNILGRRCEREVADITEILHSLKSSLQEELKKETMPEQLEMTFSEEEKRQVRRDRRALEDRLARIDGEIELETRSIESRYASPSDHTFPVAVVFVVPEGWKQGVSA